MASKRIILFPGFGEDAFCFRALKPYLKAYEVVDIDYRPILNKFLISSISVQKFAKQIIQYYGISEQDKLIGHSMGGYFAFAIREELNNEICMIGAFSNPNKIVRLSENQPITLFLTLTGFTSSSFMKQWQLKNAKGKFYEDTLAEVLNNFNKFSNYQLAKMVRLSFGNEILSNKPNPLRIHAKNDNVVRPPDEKYKEVEGGHFAQLIYPEQVIDQMQAFLKFEEINI